MSYLATLNKESSSCPTKKNLSKLKILLVDDSVINQRIISRMLSILNYEVDIAADGKQALSLYQNGYDAMILDFELPDMTGEQICKIIRESEATTRIFLPIIIATAHNDESILKKCFSAGADKFINKPIPINTLNQIFCEIFDKKQTQFMSNIYGI